MERGKEERKEGGMMTLVQCDSLFAFSLLTNNQTQQFALYCCVCFSEALEKCAAFLKTQISAVNKAVHSL